MRLATQLWVLIRFEVSGMRNEHSLENRVLMEGKYVVGKRLGVGGMGVVYLARQTNIERSVAVKFIHQDLVADKLTRQRFFREVRVMAKLSSPHCVTIFDFGETDEGILFLVMEYLKGRSLAQVLLTDGALPLRVFYDWMGQVCRGVEAAHAKGIVHRDLKPENIFVQDDKMGARIKILDFGISRIVDNLSGYEPTTMSKPGSVVGTIRYMSPEQVNGDKCDGRTDVFSLGLIAYECLTGEPAYPQKKTPELLASVAAANIPDLHSCKPDVPVGLKAVLERSLVKDVETRIQNVQSFRLAIDAEWQLYTIEMSGTAEINTDNGDWRKWAVTQSDGSFVQKNDVSLGMSSSVREEHRFLDLRKFLNVLTSWMSVPLFMAFWVADLIYAPHLKWEFLGIRSLVIALGLGMGRLINRIQSMKGLQTLGIVFIGLNATAITVMALFAEGPDSQYYAGLNLVAVGSLTFLPWTRVAWLVNALVIYSPYLVCSLFLLSPDAKADFVLNCFFMMATLVIAWVSRVHTEQLRSQEIAAAARLQRELDDRDATIIRKTKESLRFRELSLQFSPQVVDAIQSGSISIGSGVVNQPICVIHVEIVHFSERVSRLEYENVKVATEAFLNVAVTVMMQHGVTVDRFLGHALTGFSNAPIAQGDYIDRCLRAALELQETVAKKHAFYLDHWFRQFELKISVVAGGAMVGFFGASNEFRRYSAMGRAVELARQLVALSKPQQILFSGWHEGQLRASGVSLLKRKRQKIPGHGDDLFMIAEVARADDVSSEAEQSQETLGLAQTIKLGKER